MELFAEDLPTGWVYPCRLEELSERLLQLPGEDLRGLFSVGLSAATRKDWRANARYFFGRKPIIRIYSFREDLTFKLPSHTRTADIDSELAVELAYGLGIIRIGARYAARWEPHALCRFTLEHVLAHEVGHHVYHWSRKEAGHVHRPHTVEAEQFAAAYALRVRLKVRNSR